MNKILLIFFILIISSCFAHAQIPLQIGNRWDFVDHSWTASGYSEFDTLSLSIYADTMIGGLTYFRFWDNPYISDFIRSDSVGVYFYDVLNHKEWLFYKFDLQVGQYIENAYYVPPTDTNNFMIIGKSSDDSTSIFGLRVRGMTFYRSQGLDNVHGLTISSRFGFMFMDESNIMFNEDISLIGCKINGTIYGTLTSVVNYRNVPNIFILFQNYPNPFNPNTTIEYQLTTSEIVSLKVYDILGKEVRTLQSGLLQSAGKHKVIFYGDGLSSGIYFYKLITKGNSSPLVKKMILLK